MISKSIDFRYMHCASIDLKASFYAPGDKPTMDLIDPPVETITSTVLDLKHEASHYRAMYTDPILVDMALRSPSYGLVRFSVTLVAKGQPGPQSNKVSLLHKDEYGDERGQVEKLCSSSIVINHAREYAYQDMTNWLGRVGPDIWANLFYGRVLVKSPVDRRQQFLPEIIIELNDDEKWSRERIAEWVDSLGDAVPSIPMFPYSWILEDRPLAVDTQWKV